MKLLRLMTVLILALSSANSMAQSRTGLPLDLNYLMSKGMVIQHLKLIDMYRVESDHADTIAYIVPAPDTRTKNSLFLKFHQNELIQIASMKSGMSKSLHDNYMNELLVMAQRWKSQGVEIMHEVPDHFLYSYRETRSYITIHGGLSSEGSTGYSVSIEFTERKYRDERRSGLSR